MAGQSFGLTKEDGIFQVSAGSIYETVKVNKAFNAASLRAQPVDELFPTSRLAALAVDLVQAGRVGAGNARRRA
jgi:hypothetical protein